MPTADGELLNDPHDLAEHVARCEPSVRLPCLGESLFGGDRHLQLCRRDRRVQLREFADSRNVAIDCHAQSEPRARDRLYPEGVCHSAAAVAPDSIDTLLERLTAGEVQHGINAIWRDAPRGLHNVSGDAVYDHIGAQGRHKCCAGSISDGGERHCG